MYKPGNYPILDTIHYPADVRKLSKDQLPALARELREYLTHTVSISGGHFAAGLGTVELTIALHYVFDTPADQLVWDVGHQAYPHKILTGRKEAMPTIRTKGGVSAFPSRAESEYDAFGVGHSSTSISAALGMAIASNLKGEDKQMVAIIGDGSITGGMAFEAMNHAGAARRQPAGDPERQRDVDLAAGRGHEQLPDQDPVQPAVFLRARGKQEGAEPHAQRLGAGAQDRRAHEGHDRARHPVRGTGLQLHRTDRRPRPGHAGLDPGEPQADFGPALPAHRHQKRQGLCPGREEIPWPITACRPSIRARTACPNRRPRRTRAIPKCSASWLCDMAGQDERLLGITPAMREGSGLVKFSERFPKRYFDVAIAEQHAVTLAAGQACQGAKPVVAIYSTFLQRAYDQLIHDVALQNLDVLFALDRAGLVGPDGPTHAGSFDHSYLRCIPNMLIMAPADENECRQMLTTGYHYEGPAAVRYPRGKGPGVAGAGRPDQLADRQGRDPPPGQPHRDPGLGQHGGAGPGGRQAPECDGRQHALRQADR